MLCSVYWRRCDVLCCVVCIGDVVVHYVVETLFCIVLCSVLCCGDVVMNCVV